MRLAPHVGVVLCLFGCHGDKGLVRESDTVDTETDTDIDTNTDTDTDTDMDTDSDTDT
ncbi:MAG: hypothetical protein HN348_04555, partial [Proteobacteria bacterium]|nr:hypothetical protein [Pseudomonadota bacterium]